MQHSTNHNLKLMEATDNVRRQDFVDNFNALDNAISPFYVATESAANTYKVTTGANKTILQNGYSIRVAIPKNSTGAVSITVDSVTVPVKKPNGNAVTNFKQNAVYSLVFYNSVFTLTSGSGGDDVNFTSSRLLTGYSANDSNGEKIDGTMPNKGSVTQSLSANGTINLGLGYYDSIKITQSLRTKGATVWTPSTSAQSIDSGTYLVGTQTIKGDTNLAPQNIRSGVSIFGVGGTLSVQSLGGYTKSDIQNKGIVTRYKVEKQSEVALNLNGTSNNMYEVLQKYIYYVRDSGNKYCEVFYIDRNFNNLIFCKSKGTASSSQNKDYYDYLQFVDFASFKTTENTRTYLPLDQVGEGKKYSRIPLEGTTKYGKLTVNEFRSNSSSGHSWCSKSTIRLETKAMTYDLFTLDHYAWLFNYSSSSDTFTTIVNKRGADDRNHQYKTVYKIVPEIVDKNGNVI